VNDELIAIGVECGGRFDTSHEGIMTKFGLRVCTKYLSGSRKRKPLCLLFFSTVVLRSGLEEDGFVAEGAGESQLVSRGRLS